MPVSVRRDLALRTPQARVLAALMPANPALPPFLWPCLTRAVLARRAGYTAISGSVTRALNGIQPGSSSDAAPNGTPGKGHPGLLARGMIEEFILDIEGVKEVNYRATALGVQAYQTYIATHGELPELKDKEGCINDRYRKTDQNTENS